MIAKKIKSFLKTFLAFMQWEVGGGIRSILNHRNEKRKYKNKKRVEIYSKISLTREQKNKIDNFYKENYGKKVPHIWHRHFMAFTGNFDEKYIPELLYIPEFEAYMNLNKPYNFVCSDKNVLQYFAQSAGVRIPETIISCTKGIFRDEQNQFIDKKEVLEILCNIGKVFIKPSVNTGSGVNCFVIDVSEGTDIISGKKMDDIIKEMGQDFVVQKLIKCHKSITNIYSGSVNTFRVISYLWNGEVRLLPAIMRIGRGGNFVDNAHAGGMFIAVDDDGTLHKTAFTEFKNEYESHPDTNLKYEGYRIELFPEVLSAAKRMHEIIPQIGVVNWDFTIDEDGQPVLIEINISGGSVWLSQMAHGKGAFGEYTAEVLQWMAQMRKLSYFEKRKYAYGKMK